MNGESTKRIAICAGGTGGHVFPAMSIAEAFIEQCYDIVWIGVLGGIEQKIAARLPCRLELIDFRGKTTLGRLWGLARAVYLALRILRKHKPNAVLGMGGYPTLPPLIAARLLSIPIVIHEQNTVLGRANKVLARWADRVLCAYREPKGLASRRCDIVGNPVRAEFFAIPQPQNEQPNRLRILILGGSQGAAALNEKLPGLLVQWWKEKKRDKKYNDDFRLQIVHQSGASHRENTEQSYRAARTNEDDTGDSWHATVHPFIDDIADEMARADIVIARAGASTLAELAAVGCCAILIPLPTAMADHQTGNALYFSEQHAALHLPQAQLSPASLASCLNALSEKSDRTAMRDRMKSFAVPDAAGKIVNICGEVLAHA